MSDTTMQHVHRWAADLSRVDLGERPRAKRRYPPIIGLLAPMGGGKTTLANAIVAEVNGVRMSFAQPIRDMLIALGVEPDALAARKTEPISWLYDQTPRQLMRSLGTEWGRELVGCDLWVRAVLRMAEAQTRPVVVDDVRFDNEARLLSDAGACLVYLNHPSVRFTYEHQTEWGLRDWSCLNLVASLGERAQQSDDAASLPHHGTVTPAWIDYSHQHGPAHELNPAVPRQPWWIRASYLPLRMKLAIARARRRPRPVGAALSRPDYVAQRVCRAWVEHDYT